MTTKVCKECGKELPLEMFHEHHLSCDGKMSVCKICREARKQQKAKVEMVVRPLASGGNPELAKFTPRELMIELKSRNYVGKLYYTKEIDLARL